MKKYLLHLQELVIRVTAVSKDIKVLLGLLERKEQLDHRALLEHRVSLE